MEVWLKQNEINFRFAVNPQTYNVESSQNNTTVFLPATGEVSLFGKENLKKVSFSSFFPRKNYYFCQYSIFPTPEESISIIEKMKNSGPLRLLMIGTSINLLAILQNFSYNESDGTGDIDFSMDFLEYKKIHIPKKTVDIVGTTVVLAETERLSKEVKNMEYIVKKGDNLSKISKNLTGTSANWKAIYQQNISVIGDNPNLIYPGQKLVILV